MKCFIRISCSVRGFCLGVMLSTTPSCFAQGVIYSKPQQPIQYSAGLVDSTTDIDINGDGTPDFAIISTSGFSASIAPLGNNSIVATPEPPPDLGYLVTALNQGTTIGSSLDPALGAQWYNNKTDQFGSAFIGGMALVDGQLSVISEFAGKPSAYAGFDLVYDGADHYGWMQLQNPLGIVNGQIVDWAYESAPNTPIAVGAVPEPNAYALLLATGGAIILWKRRKQCFRN